MSYSASRSSCWYQVGGLVAGFAVDAYNVAFRVPNLVRDLVSRGYAALQTGKWWEGDPIKTAGFTHAMTQGEAKGSRHGDVGLDIGPVLLGQGGMNAVRQQGVQLRAVDLLCVRQFAERGKDFSRTRHPGPRYGFQ